MGRPLTLDETSSIAETNDSVVKFQSFKSLCNYQVDISLISRAVKRLRANSETMENKLVMASGRSQRDRLEVPKVTEEQVRGPKDGISTFTLSPRAGLSVNSSLMSRPQLFSWSSYIHP